MTWTGERLIRLGSLKDDSARLKAREHAATRLTGGRPQPHSLPNSGVLLTSSIAWVISMSRGHASVQLKTVRQRQTPLRVLRTARRSSAPSSRLSKMKRWAVTMAAGPTNSLLAQNGGHEVVQAAHRMHLVPSSYLAR